MEDLLAPTWHKRSIARELMAFQNRSFAAKLIGMFDKLYKEANTPARAQGHPLRGEIEKLVHDETGTLIKLRFNTLNPPCCMPIMGNSNHVLTSMRVPSIYLEQETTFLEAVKKKKNAVGGFDAKRGKLTGIYSEIEAPVWMSWTYIRSYFSPEESAGVLMHEVGHCSLSFQFMFRTYRASQILASLHQIRTGRDQSLTYEAAIKIAGEELCNNPLEFERMVDIKNDKALATIVYTRTWAQLGNDFGDISVTGPNFEALADNYAARWGFAEPLATALYTLYGAQGLGADNRTSATVTYLVNTILPVLIGGGYGSMIGGLGGFLTGVAIVAALCVVGQGRGDLAGTYQQANVYDTPMTRMQRLRESVIEQMKLELDQDQRKALLDEFKVIDEMLKGRKEVSNLWKDIATLLPHNWRAEAAFQLERDIEQLANNDLFASSQQLFQAAKA